MLDSLDEDRLNKIAFSAQELLDQRKLETFEPYAPQMVFFERGATHRERLLTAGNQCGKTICGAYEMACHLTGRYPEWWPGRRFAKPVTAWAASTSALATRDAPQRNLLGHIGELGKGMLPKASIESVSRARGTADAIDTVKVRHISGGLSTLGFKSYEQGRERWQGATLDLLWCDEEPPQDVYDEGVMRTNATGGMVYTTFTPLLGMSKVVRCFFPRPNTLQRSLTTMSMREVGHISPEQLEAIIASTPEHMRRARIDGIPVLGEGAVFPIPESEILADEDQTIPPHWPRIIGCDIGWDHPTAFVMLAWDRDADVMYVARDYAVSKKTPAEHAMTIRTWGKWPLVLPHDALQHDKTSGKTMMKMYTDQGLNVVQQHSTFAEGGYSLEAGLLEMLERMQTGRWKVLRSCKLWLEEFRGYHRSDGRVVKEHDDCISASRMAMMMRRFAAFPADAEGAPLRRNLTRLV